MPKLFMLAADLQALFAQMAEKKEEGATAVEYGLLVSLIAIVMIVGVKLFGTRLNTAARLRPDTPGRPERGTGLGGHPALSGVRPAGERPGL